MINRSNLSKRSCDKPDRVALPKRTLNLPVRNTQESIIPIPREENLCLWISMLSLLKHHMTSIFRAESLHRVREWHVMHMCPPPSPPPSPLFSPTWTSNLQLQALRLFSSALSRTWSNNRSGIWLGYYYSINYEIRMWKRKQKRLRFQSANWINLIHPIMGGVQKKSLHN